jgi:hypothetical protein
MLQFHAWDSRREPPRRLRLPLGTSINDSCAAKCGSRTGVFVSLNALADVVLKGLSVVDCSSASGSISKLSVRASEFGSNLTSLREDGGRGR